MPPPKLADLLSACTDFNTSVPYHGDSGTNPSPKPRRSPNPSNKAASLQNSLRITHATTSSNATNSFDQLTSSDEPTPSSFTPPFMTNPPPTNPANPTTTAPYPPPHPSITLPILPSLPRLTPAQASTAWTACLLEASDDVRYPRAQPIHGRYSTMEEMYAARKRGEGDEINPFRRPHGPERVHIALIQKLFWEDKMSVDQIAGVMVEVYPLLERGAKGGREVERREMVWGLVNVWVSKWAARVL